MKHLTAKVGDKPTHIIGYSTGAPLAIHHALDVMDGIIDGALPDSLVLISPSIGITPVAALAQWKCRMAGVPGLEKLAWTQVLPEFDLPWYRVRLQSATTHFQ